MLKVVFITADQANHEIAAIPGQSLMEAAIASNVSGIIAECGGGAICGTCHVHIDESWRERIGPPEDFEDDILDMVSALTPASRLACQIFLDEGHDGLVVHVPALPNA